MFKAKSVLFIYVETPLHAGTGRGLGAVDLPIQRERTTQYPIVQASSVKGRLRAATDPEQQPTPTLSKEEHLAIFGTTDASGALSTGDARLLLFPVRSLAGVFAWTTSVDALARFRREAEIAGLTPSWDELTDGPKTSNDKSEAWINGDQLVAGGSVVLEEFSFSPVQNPIVKTIGEWLKDHALPKTGYDYWKKALPDKLCILPEDAFRDFVLYGTEVQTHIQLNPDTKTVAGTALWTSESLPVDTLMYAPLMATQSRAKGTELNGEAIMEKLKGLNLVRTQLGGDETTGQGWVSLRFAAGGEQ
jgi:CRISPR-associated protein Cmr4